MPNPVEGRPVRSAKQVKPAPGYVDSGTLLFDSEDEGTESEAEHDENNDCNNESDDEDRHIAKKPRLGARLKAQPKSRSPPPPPLDSSCLAYYPETYEAVQLWNKTLHLPPPNPFSDVSASKRLERGVDVPEPRAAKTLLSQGAINKNDSYDETKIGFEKLPGEIRSR